MDMTMNDNAKATVFRHPTSDRWTLHRALCESFLEPGQTQDFSYDVVSDDLSIVRHRSDEPVYPDGEFLFRITYSPKNRQYSGDGTSRPKFYDIEGYEQWLLKRLEGPLDISMMETAKHDLLVNANGHRRKIRGAITYATARIIDPVALDPIWRRGIGQARCYGFGMIVPIGDGNLPLALAAA